MIFYLGFILNQQQNLSQIIEQRKSKIHSSEYTLASLKGISSIQSSPILLNLTTQLKWRFCIYFECFNFSVDSLDKKSYASYKLENYTHMEETCILNPSSTMQYGLPAFSCKQGLLLNGVNNKDVIYLCVNLRPRIGLPKLRFEISITTIDY